MASQQTATVSITNDTDSIAYIQLFHQNDSNGTQNGAWMAQPGQTVGPMTVHFETGWGSFGILDWWAVVIAVDGGSTPGIYQNAGTVAFPHWKECQLQHGDAGKNITLSVSTSQFAVNLPSGGCSDGMSRLSDFSKITNVFVLMLENHSFDNVFGQSGIPGIIHATSADSNEYGGTPYPVGSPAPLSMPTDPGHEFQDVFEQLGGVGATYPPGGPYPPITNAGFAANYATTTTEGPPPPAADIGEIMLGFDTPAQMPVIYGLAAEFAICDQWFSSLPGPTWPNRFFLHGASSAGLDHSPTSTEIATWETVDGFTYPHGSIFGALGAAGLGWRIYNDNTDAYSDDPQNGSSFGAVPQVSSLKGITLLDINSLTHFASDLQVPYTSQYTFIEPNYGDVTGNTYRGGSSQHPMDDVYGGEGLLKAVYEAIRSSPVWNTSLLIVTYDEHGGFYDSVAPPPVTPPNDGSSNQYNQWGFTFDQLGVRVPAVVVSPWIGQSVVDSTVYDHSSVPKTLEQLFGFGPLTDRDAAASGVLGLLNQPSPRSDAPTSLDTPAPPRERRELTPEDRAAEDAQPIEKAGSLPGFLGAAMSTEIALAGGAPDVRAALIAEYAAISTRGQARSRIARVVALADAVKARTPDPNAPPVPVHHGR
ncbi:MAG TPA: alkaline phosphatase family protein [Solirubrobacteraceae bacterium]|jgi:phospholipase C|nr:alkaline phosphatase family protein [Solirubrobacteraceae bacterium]